MVQPDLLRTQRTRLGEQYGSPKETQLISAEQLITPPHWVPVLQIFCKHSETQEMQPDLLRP